MEEMGDFPQIREKLENNCLALHIVRVSIWMLWISSVSNQGPLEPLVCLRRIKTRGIHSPLASTSKRWRPLASSLAPLQIHLLTCLKIFMRENR